MKTLYLIRHAQSQANIGGRALPDREIPITDEGRQQAQTLCRVWQIQPTHIFCSQMLRTQQTARPFSEKYGMAAQPLKDLNEFSYLDFQMIQGATLAQRQDMAQQFWQTAEPYTRSAPSCDSFDAFSQRVERFWRNLPQYEHNSLFFTHGMWIARLMWLSENRRVTDNADMRRFRQFVTERKIANTAVFAVTVHNGGADIKEILFD